METQKWYGKRDAFDRIMGDCAGVIIGSLTDDDVIRQAKIWEKSGQRCPPDMIEDAIAGLHIYQDQEF